MERSPSGRPCPAGAPMKICEAKFHGEVRSDVGMKKAPVLRPGLLHGPKSATNWSWWTDSNPRPADYKLHILAFALLGAVQYIAVQSHSSCAVIPYCAALLCRIVDQKLTIANKNPGGAHIFPPGHFSLFLHLEFW